MAGFFQKVLLAILCGASMGFTLFVCLRVCSPMPAYAQDGGHQVLDLIRARRVEITDTAGKIRLFMATNNQGVASIAILDGTGVSRINMTVAQDGTSTYYQYQPPGQPAAPAVAIDPGLSLKEVQIIQEQYGTYLVGSVKNTTTMMYKSVQLHFNIYDADGAQLGNVSTITTNLEPGSTWKFRTPVGYRNAHTCKLKELKGRQ